MLRVLDIGNTHTRIADWDGSVFGPVQIVDTVELVKLYESPDFPVAAACVYPEIRKQLDGRGIEFISALNQCSNVDFSQVDCNTIGADRVANAIALAEFFPLPGAVIDCGTAITLELVDENKRFVGGAIAPGRALMRQSLAQGTHQLPQSGISEVIPREPGRNTLDAIAFGVGHCAIGVVRELAEAARRQFDLKTLIITGGDAKFYREFFPEAIFPCREFTLHGVRLAACKK